MDKTYLKRLVVGASVGAALLASTSVIYGADETDVTRPALNCENLQKRIEQRIANYKNLREKHQANYDRIADRIRKLVTLFDEKGNDTAQLVADLKTLDEKIAKFASDADAAVKKLEEANDFVCGKSEGKFKSTLKEAKDLFDVARQSAKDVKDFLNTTIKDDLLALRNQKPSPTPVPTTSQ